jgi:hypothetical protein
METQYMVAKHEQHSRRFDRWLKDQVKLVTAVVAAGPFALDYFGTFDHLEREKLTTSVVSVLCALIFLSVYWLRFGLKSGWWLVIGFSFLLFGLFDLWTLDWEAIKSVRPYLNYNIQYAAGMLLSTLGLSLMFVSAYVRHVGRPRTLLELAPALARKQWLLLSNVAEVLVDINDALETVDHRSVVEHPFRQSADYLIRETHERLKPLQRGLIKLQPLNPQTIFSYFISAVEKTFRATSYDDLAFWISPAGKAYLEENQRLLKHGVKIKRIFILPSDTPVLEQCIEAILMHVKAGIVVRITSSVRASEIADDHDIERNLDFGLLDDFAVSYWHHSEGKALWISVNQADIEKYANCYKTLEAASPAVNDAGEPTESSLSTCESRLRDILATSC